MTAVKSENQKKIKINNGIISNQCDRVPMRRFNRFKIKQTPRSPSFAASGLPNATKGSKVNRNTAPAMTVSEKNNIKVSEMVLW
jgi:hypothetical protein